MTLKNDGKVRTSKASKGKGKSRKIKCPSCKEIIEYNESDIIRISSLQYIECDFCGLEILLK